MLFPVGLNYYFTQNQGISIANFKGIDQQQQQPISLENILKEADAQVI
jgi:hypothetical protein